VADRITWYDILGVAPGAAAETVRFAYQAKAKQLQGYQIAGAPQEVAQAVARGQKIIDAAWLILGNRAQREHYDKQIGAVRQGTGLAWPEPTASRPGLDLLDAAADALDAAADAMYLGEMLGLGVLADLLATIPRQSPRRSEPVIVPDVRGLFFRACTDALTMAGFHISTLRLTEDPMPVEGLVVGQSPAAGQSVLRFSTLTLQVWHPPRVPSRGR
jgi:hypothetical protein